MYIMYLNFKKYEAKYKKYKTKYVLYKALQNQLSCAKSNLIGGECVSLPNPEEEDIVSRENLLDLCPEERITIQNKCYEVKGLHRWIIEENKKKLPFTQTEITTEEKQILIQAYEALPKIPVSTILTRDKLIEVYPNLQHETYIDLGNEKYTDIALDTFSDNLTKLTYIRLNNNQLKKIQLGTFTNSTFCNNLLHLSLTYNKIQELQPGIFNNLLKLTDLHLGYNQIQEIQSGTFNNLPRLAYLSLNNNQIRELQPDIFNNLSNLYICF